MHSPLTFHSYLKPATSPQVSKMNNKVRNFGFFPIDMDITWFIFHHNPLKNPVNVIKKIFSVIKIYKQSLNHKFRGFILILSVPWGPLRTKCPCHTTFFHWSGIFLICLCGNTDNSLDGHRGSDGFILTIRTLSPSEVLKLKLMSTFHRTYISESWDYRCWCFTCLAHQLSSA